MGVPVSTLEIELRTNVARLSSELAQVKREVGAMAADVGRNAKAANDNLGQVGKGAREYAREIAALKASLDPAWASQQKYNREVQLGMQAFKAGAIDRQQFIQHMRQINAELKGAPDGMARTGGAGRMLGQQLSQVAQQAAAGGNALNALALQLPDIVGQLGAAEAGAGKFATFLRGPWGIAIASAVAVLVPLIGGLLDVDDKSKKAEKATRSFSEVLLDGKSSWEEITKAAKEYADQQEKSRELTIDSMEAEANAIAIRLGHARVTRVLLAAELEMAKVRSEALGVPMPGVAVGDQAVAAAGAAAAEFSIEAQIKKNKAAIDELKVAEQELIATLSGELAKLRTDDEHRLKTGFDQQRKYADETIRDLGKLAARKAQIARDEEAALDRLNAKAKTTRDETLKLSNVTGAEIARALGTTINSGKRTAAQNRAAGGADNSYHLIGQAIDIPLTVGGKPLTKAGIRAALAPLGVEIKELLGPGDKNHDDHFHIAFGLKRLTPDQVRDAEEDAAKAAQKVVDAWNKVLADLETSTIQAFVDATAAAQAQMDAAAGKDWDAMMADLAARDAIRKDQQEAQRVESERNRNRALNTAHEIADIIGGGVGRAIGDLADALDRAFPKLMESIGGALGGLGEFFKNAGKTFAVGSAAADLVGGSKTGGGIGALLGKGVGEMVGKTMGELGKFAGPLGAIAGGILGGIIGGMLKSTPRASATVSIVAGKAMETAIVGNSGKLKKIAGEMADGLLAGLEKIAESLGAEIAGNASVSIGVRKGNYRVDPTGQGITKTSRGAIDFGEDRAAAEAYAMLLAIRQLDFTGVSASVKTLLTLTDDLSSNLSKATQFKGVFDDLAERTNPQAFALDQLGKWRTSMDKLFAEAGATAEELAQLEELTGLKRTEILDKFLKQTEDTAAAIAQQAADLQLRLAEAKGDSAEVLQLTREREMAAIDPLNRALLEMVYTAEDLAKAAAEADEAQKAQIASAKALAAANLDLDQRLLKVRAGQGDTAAAQSARANDLRGFIDSAVQGLDPRDPATQAVRDKAMTTFWAEFNAGLAGSAANDNRAASPVDNYAASNAGRGLLDEYYTQLYGGADAAAAEAEELRARLTAAYEREAGALRQVIDEMTEMQKVLREYRDSLFGRANTFDPMSRIRTQLVDAGRLAGGGDLAAMRSIPGLGDAFLVEARRKARTAEEFRDQVRFVAGIAGLGIDGAQHRIDHDQASLDLMTRMVDGVATTNQKLETVIELLGKSGVDTKRLFQVMNDVTEGGAGMRAAA